MLPTPAQRATVRRTLSKTRPYTLLVVQWVDAYERGELSGKAESVPVAEREHALVQTPGWFLRVENNILAIGHDLWPLAPDEVVRGIYNIPLDWILKIRAFKLAGPRGS